MTALTEYRVRDAVAEIGLNRPDKLNAINRRMRGELQAHLDRAGSDDNVRALILYGNGRAFSAGFDLDAGKPRAGESRQAFLRRELTEDFDLIMRVHDFAKPTIAAVHGFCLGSSMEISAVCDLTVAAEACRFGAPEVRYGSGIVCLVLPWIIGQKHAREMLLTGSDRIDATRAAAMGLVNRVVPESDLMSVARTLAAEIAQNDAHAVQMTKQALNRSLELAGMRDALRQALATDIVIEGHETPETREFNRILGEAGPKAALAWRRGQLGIADD